jgi:hypothetical protein
MAAEPAFPSRTPACSCVEVLQREGNKVTVIINLKISLKMRFCFAICSALLTIFVGLAASNADDLKTPWVQIFIPLFLMDGCLLSLVQMDVTWRQNSKILLLVVSKLLFEILLSCKLDNIIHAQYIAISSPFLFFLSYLAIIFGIEMKRISDTIED